MLSWRRLNVFVQIFNFLFVIADVNLVSEQTAWINSQTNFTASNVSNANDSSSASFTGNFTTLTSTLKPEFAMSSTGRTHHTMKKDFRSVESDFDNVIDTSSDVDIHSNFNDEVPVDPVNPSETDIPECIVVPRRIQDDSIFQPVIPIFDETTGNLYFVNIIFSLGRIKGVYIETCNDRHFLTA